MFLYIYTMDIEALKAEYLAQKKVIESQGLVIAKLQHQLDILLKQIYGRKSERFIPDTTNQPTLFSQVPQIEPEVQKETPREKEIVATYQRNKNHKGRRLTEGCEHLPIREEVIEIDCPEGFVKMGEVKSEKIGIDVLKLFLRVILRTKYVNSQTGEILLAPMPEEALPKCEADETLLAHIAVSKFVDHLPEHRIQQMLKREQVAIPPSTMNTWTQKMAELFKLVAMQIRKEILAGKYIQMDETTIKVLFVKKDKTHQGYMWVVVDPRTRNTYFEYREGRNRAGPRLMLKDFQGKVQSDGYVVYDVIDAELSDIDHYNCWTHARRKFIEALSDNKAVCEHTLMLIQKLYEVEAGCRNDNCSLDERYERRQTYSLPIMESLKEWMDQQALVITPGCPTGKAIAYCNRRWTNLIKYANTGNVEIDNNLVENAIRPLALGRKNYLFAGGHDAAVNIGYYYTVFSTCKAQDVNPYDYALWFLRKINNTKITEIDSLTPSAYKNLVVN